MTSPVRTVPLGAKLDQVSDLLETGTVSSFAVVDAEMNLAGVISRSDLLSAGDYDEARSFRLPDVAVEQIMSQPPLTVDQDAPLTEAARSMLKSRVHRLFVTSGDDKQLVGVVSTRDLMRAVKDKGVKTPLREIATFSLVKVKPDDAIGLALDRLERSNKHGLVVVDGSWPIGVFDQTAALRSRGFPGTHPVESVMSWAILAVHGDLAVGRVAAQALAMQVRRLLLIDDLGVQGIVSGLDFARIVA